MKTQLLYLEVGADAYEAGGEFHQRATAFFAAVKWDQLATVYLAPSGRNSLSVTSTSSGESYLRTVLVGLGAVIGDREMLDVARTLKVEVASMKFLKYVNCENA